MDSPSTYLLYFEDEAIPLDGSVTLGNHLDNDIIIAGEDVADFHLRIELSNRGPVVVPLANATVNVNGVEADQAQRVIIGDVIGVGQATVQIGIEVESDVGLPEEWWLHEADGAEYQVVAELSVGRAEGADVTLNNTHISRFHARLVERSGLLWVQDLRSANGTFINGERVYGGAQVFHGDEVRFDKQVFQVLGRGGDLTPLNRFVEPHRGASQPLPASTHTPAAHRQEPPAAPPDVASIAASAGVARLTRLDSELPAVYPLPAGDCHLGSDSRCEIHLDDDAVAPQQCRLSGTLEGVMISQLLAGTPTLVNDQPIDRCLLHDGDVIAVGAVRLQFSHAGSQATARGPALTRIHLVVGGLATVAAVGLVLLLI